MSKKFPQLSVENYYQAAVGPVLLASIYSKNLVLALRHFNTTIDPRVTGFEIYRDGKLKYTYDRETDRLRTVFKQAQFKDSYQTEPL